MTLEDEWVRSLVWKSRPIAELERDELLEIITHLIGIEQARWRQRDPGNNHRADEFVA